MLAQNQNLREKNGAQQEQLQNLQCKLKISEEKRGELVEMMEGMLSGSVLSWEKLKSDKSLRSICDLLTPFPTGNIKMHDFITIVTVHFLCMHAVEANETFLEWLNQDGVAENLLIYESGKEQGARAVVMRNVNRQWR